MTEHFRAISQNMQANAGMMPEIRPRPLLCHFVLNCLLKNCPQNLLYENSCK